ncbi:MAG: T9SS type A sorting domain-containing protein [Ignavibacteriae bacterium]|nr:T9SS type A sorting domain-containing protein [Ignavibacteriota bacterium]
MKKILILLILFISAYSFAQNASTYFPAATGYKWYYKNIPLDSLNNPVIALTRYRIDSFAVVTDYRGLSANVVRLKDNLLSFNQNTAYNDTNYHNFQTTNGWEYLKASMISDTIPVPGFLNFLRGLENWYSMFRFANAVNSEYVVLQKDTTIAIDTATSAPIRVKVRVKRLNDETISTVNGNYTCKKFVSIYGIYYHFIIIDIPVLEKPDTTWFSQNVWMVKRVSPSANVDLSQFGVPISFSVPGNIYELANPSIGIQNISSEIPAAFSLKQNYPNPFNPSTNVKFSIVNAGDVKIVVYDIQGREVQTLVNERLQAGTYDVTFDGSRLNSGVYFYKLTANGFTDTKRMLMIK